MGFLTDFAHFFKEKVGYNNSRSNLNDYIYEHIPSTVLVFSPNYRLILANKHARNFLNISKISNQCLSDLFKISPNDAEEMISSAIKRNDKHDSRLISQADNTPCTLSFMPVFGNSGKLYRIVCFVNDLSKEIEMLKSIDDTKKRLQKELNEKTTQVEHLTLQSITTIANTIDAKDQYTKGHSIRVAEYSALLAKKCDWRDEDVQNIKYIALLHDIGKIGVPDSVLNKPGKLNEAEFDMIKSHTTVGGKILHDITMIKGVDIGALYHHERYDGKGYPKGLKGHEIPSIARIICIADAYDAMNSKRIYRNQLPEDVIREQLIGGRGTQFDPFFLDMFLELLDNNELIINNHYEERDNTIALESSRLLSQIMENIDLEKQLESELDFLTGVYNRKGGEKYISAAMKNAPGCLAFIDLDNMKTVNDIYGHLSGDHAIKELGNVLKHNSNNAIISRIGGDEFIYFMENTDETHAKAITEGILHTFRSHKENDPVLKVSSLSIGLCMTKPDDTYEDVYQKADKALYFIKQNGKDGYFLYSQQNSSPSKNAPDVDLKKLVTSLQLQGAYEGALGVEYREFAKIYDFLTNMSARYHNDMHLLLITLEPAEDAVVYPDIQEEAMNHMGKAINSTLRNVDISTRFSSQQYLVILFNADKNSLQMIVNRIFNQFYKMYDRKNIVPSYNFADISNIT